MPIHENLATALAAFQAELPKMSKDETAKVKGESKRGGEVNYSYSYAGLDQFVEIVEPVLGKHGLSITAKTIIAPAFMLEVSLLHETGERETGYWPLPDPVRFGPQDIGSSMTYGRRYVGWGLTGTFPGGIDDDGRQAQQASRERWEDAKPRQQANKPVSAPPAPPAAEKKTSWTDEEVLAIQTKLGKAAVDKAVVAYDWMAERSLHSRKVGHPDGPQGARTATDVLAGLLGDAALAPNATVDDVFGFRQVATDRALLKVQVSDTETLDQVLAEARDLAQYAADHEASQDGGPLESAADLRAEQP